jgi:GTP pyrophosphokinase
MSQELRVQLEGLIQKIQSYHPDPDVEMVRRAFALAEEKHREQRRRSGELYLSHPLAVCDIIAQMHLDVPSICAGILHDIVEDTDVTVAELGSKFSPEIAFIVDGVTKLSKLAFNNHEERQAESFRKMLLAMSADLRVILVKLADRVHNMRTLEHMPEHKRVRIAQETLDIYAPLAHRLGIYWMKSELEDVAFKYLWPEDYEVISNHVALKKGEREKFIEETIQEIHGRLAKAGVETEVSGRPKHYYSIWRKMRDNNIPFDQVYDLLAFRVITDKARCYEVLGHVHSMWRPVPGRFKDYIAMPKPNGYQSLHTSVIGPYHQRIEIQIRSEDMHAIAEQGVAAHWQYKEAKGKKPAQKNGTPADLDRFVWLRQLIESQQDLSDPQEFMDGVKFDLFDDEIFAMTPRGDIKILPKGATPLDFAYAVHTEVGNHCVGARANGAIVPLKHALKTGDVVEILTSPHAHPSKDWLQIAHTSRARTKIKQIVRAEERERARECGRGMLEKELKLFDLSLRKVERNGELQRVLEACRVQNLDELYINIGTNQLQPDTVARRLAPDKEPRPELPPPSTLEKIARAVGAVTGNRAGIALDGVDDVTVRYARCCNPVPGDQVVGFVTRGRGLSIHVEGCARAGSLEEERKIDVYWKNTKEVHRPVGVRVTCDDKPGLLAQISTAFSNMGINIAEAHCRAVEGGAVNSFQVLVTDNKQLTRTLSAIRRIPGVSSVERVGLV